MSKVNRFAIAATAVLLLITAALLCIKLFPTNDIKTQVNPRNEPDHQLININTASVNELDTLPGIGPSLANAIIEYRQEHGPFQSIRELTDVPGIGEKLYNNICNKITIGG